MSENVVKGTKDRNRRRRGKTGKISTVGTVLEQRKPKAERLGKSRAKRRDREKKVKRVLITLGAAVLGVIAVSYIGFGFFFSKHFFFNTTLNGMDVSLKKADEVEKSMMSKVEGYVLTIVGKEKEQEIIVGKDIDIHYVANDEIKKLISEQNQLEWIKSLWKQVNIETKIGVSFDSGKLVEKIKNLELMNPENQEESVDAYPEFRGGRFIIVPEKIGNQIDEEKMNAGIIKTIEGFNDTFRVYEGGCYILPRFTRNSKEVIAAGDEMNAYLGAQVTYDVTPYTEVVGAREISQWVKVDENMSVTFDEGAVRGFVASLATKYDTVGKSRQFTTATGNVVTVEGGDYGWQIDQGAEYDSLLDNIRKKEVVTREPVYSSRAASHEEMDMGNTYAEVDLTSQYMYFIQDGSIALECPIVTGNPNQGNATPQGSYWLSYKSSPATLRAPLRPDGSREYVTDVAFWMPFNGGIGFHDATWQPSFGGNRYTYAGSHGCVNMSYDTAARLYELIYANCPVICHY